MSAKQYQRLQLILAWSVILMGFFTSVVMGQVTPYYDAIGEWNDDNDPDITGFAHDIEPAVNEALDRTARHRKDVWIRPRGESSSNPLGADNVTWVIGDTLEIPKRAGGRLFASGVSNPFEDTGEGQQAMGLYGATTVLARDDDADLTWPVVRYLGQSWRIQGLHVRGAHDTDTQARPEVGFLMEKGGGGLSTGWIEMSDCTWEYFDTCVQLGGSGDTTSSEVNRFTNCIFDDAAVGVKIMHDQAQGQTFVNCSGNADILYQSVRGGPVIIERQFVLTANQTVLKIENDNHTNGRFEIREIDIDAQADGAVIVEIDDTFRGRNNKVVIDGVTDARVLPSTPSGTFLPDEVWVKAPGNSDVTIRDTIGVGLIYVKGFENGNRRFAPTILFDDCEFVHLSHLDPRVLIRKWSDGTQAVEGVDYAAVRWTNCKMGLENQGPNNAGHGELVNFYLDDYSTPQPAPVNGGPVLPRGRLAPGLLTGAAAPSDAADGFVGDLFYNTDGNVLFAPKTTTWSSLDAIADGDDGDSAYEVAVAEGFVGDEAAWLASLVGDEGPTGPAGAAGETVNIAQLLVSPLTTQAGVALSTNAGSKVLPKAGQPRLFTFDVSAHPLTVGKTVGDIEARRVVFTSNVNKPTTAAELELNTTDDAARFGDIDADGKYTVEIKATDFGTGKLKAGVDYHVTSEVDVDDGVTGNWIEQDQVLIQRFSGEGARD